MPPRSFAAPPPYLPSDAKAAARHAARRLRRELHAANPQAAQRAAALAPDWLFDPRHVVALYAPTSYEMDPTPLRARLAQAGVAVVLPVVAAPDAPLVFRLYTDDALELDLFGRPAPPSHAPVRRPTVLVAPLLAFDRRGGRLGQGGGYYDRTLAAMRDAGPVIAIGLAFAGQEVARVPLDSLDQPLDGVLTQTDYLDVKGER